MNTKLLLDVKAAILAEPEHFRMDTWSCGTAHCIGGWALMLSGNPIVNPKSSAAVQVTSAGQDAHDAAQAVLDLTRDQSHVLFCVSEWPETFAKPYREQAIAEEFAKKAAIAAARIDHFIAMDGDEVDTDYDDWDDDDDEGGV